MVAKKNNTNGRRKKKVDGRSRTSAVNGKKGGRPLAKINETLLYELAKIQCTLDEMASILQCNESTLIARFSSVIDKGKREGKASLRRSMYLQAKKGNVQMLIWLGKNVLGQADHHDVTSDGKPLIQVVGVNMAKLR